MTTARELIESFDPDEGFLLADNFAEGLIGVVEGWWASNHHRVVALFPVKSFCSDQGGRGHVGIPTSRRRAWRMTGGLMSEGS